MGDSSARHSSACAGSNACLPDAEAIYLEVVVAALQDPQSGVRLFVREKNGKKRPCFHGASLKESLAAYGLQDARRVTELLQRLVDAEFIVPFQADGGSSEAFRDERAYYFAEQLVLSRSYIADHLARAFAYFSASPYHKGSANQATIVARKKKDKDNMVDLGIFGVDMESARAKDRERTAEKERRDKEREEAARHAAAAQPPPLLRQQSNVAPHMTSSSNLLSKSPTASSFGSSNIGSSAGTKLIEYDTEEIQFAFNDDDPIPVVKAATLEKLIERLTFEEYIDMRFQLSFMTTYRAFLAPLQLLDRLRERFHQQSTAGKLDAAKQRQVRHLRVLAVISRWVQHYSEPWVDSDELRRSLGAFLDHDVQGPFPQLARQISENLHRAQENAALQRVALLVPPEPPPAAAAFTLEDSTVQEAAQQLTLYGALLFASIKGSELLGQAWSKKGKEEKAANILRFIANFNRLSGWVVYAVCTTINLKQRAAVLSRVVALAGKCRELNNFHHAMALFAALVSAPVRRLKATWAELSPATQEAFTALETLFSHSSSYKTYREALREAALPCVPYLGLALTDLTFIEEGNPERVKNCINFQRHMLLAKVLDGVHRHQAQLPRFPRNPAAMHWMQNLKTLAGDEEAYQMSLKIEPRNTVEGIEQMLMEEEKLRARLQTAEVRNAELEAEVSRLKGHIAKLDADLRAALKGESPEAVLKGRSSSGHGGAPLADVVRPRWTAVSRDSAALAGTPPGPSNAASPRVGSININNSSSSSSSGRDMVMGARLPLGSAQLHSPLSSPPSSPGRSVSTGGAQALARPSGDWARTRPSPRSPRSTGNDSERALSSSPGAPSLQLPAPTESDADGRAQMRGSNPRIFNSALVASLPVPPAPPPSKEAVIVPPPEPLGHL